MPRKPALGPRLPRESWFRRCLRWLFDPVDPGPPPLRPKQPAANHANLSPRQRVSSPPNRTKETMMANQQMSGDTAQLDQQIQSLEAQIANAGGKDTTQMQQQLDQLRQQRGQAGGQDQAQSQGTKRQPGESQNLDELVERNRNAARNPGS